MTLYQSFFEAEQIKALVSWGQVAGTLSFTVQMTTVDKTTVARIPSAQASSDKVLCRS